MRKMDYTMGFPIRRCRTEMDGQGLDGSSEGADAGTRDVRGPSRGIDIPEELAG